MPSSVREGTRPSAAWMRVYSSAVMLCWASNSGVTATGSGTSAEEAGVITIASIVARDAHSEGLRRGVESQGPFADAAFGVQLRDNVLAALRFSWRARLACSAQDKGCAIL